MRCQLGYAGIVQGLDGFEKIWRELLGHCCEFFFLFQYGKCTSLMLLLTGKKGGSRLRELRVQ